MIESRKPAESDGAFFWRCADRDAPIDDVFAFSQELLPWDVYWGMLGSKGGYVAEYPTLGGAMAALAHGVANPAKEIIARTKALETP